MSSKINKPSVYDLHKVTATRKKSAKDDFSHTGYEYEKGEATKKGVKLQPSNVEEYNKYSHHSGLRYFLDVDATKQLHESLEPEAKEEKPETKTGTETVTKNPEETPQS